MTIIASETKDMNRSMISIINAKVDEWAIRDQTDILLWGSTAVTAKFIVPSILKH